MTLRPSPFVSCAWVSLILVGCGSASDTELPPLAGSGSTSQAGSAAASGSSGSGTAVGAAGKTSLPPGTTGGASAASGGTGATAGGAGAAASNNAGRGAAGSSAGRGGTASGGAGGGGGAAGSGSMLDKFSFFVSSYAAMERLSGSPNGFGGDLRFGQADGLSGADEICRQIAETSMPGSGSKGWRAFLSVTKGPDGKPVHAIDRVGSGPWYDRLGRLVAQNKTDLATTRPTGAESAIINDLPNEDGVPNHAPDGVMQLDNHDVLTGSSATGTLYSTDWSVTCHDWTSSQGADGRPRVGHSWPRMGGGGGTRPGGGGGGMDNWMSALDEAGCAAGASLVEMGPPNPDIPTVGSGGGYGGIYCFALTP